MRTETSVHQKVMNVQTPGRARSGHDEHPLRLRWTRAAGSSPRRSASTGKSIPAPAGSNMTRQRLAQCAGHDRGGAGRGQRLGQRPLSRRRHQSARRRALLWDAATGAPLHHAIVWMDTRTQAAVDRIATQGWAIWSAQRRDCRSRPIFPRSNSPGFSTKSPAREKRGAGRGAFRHDRFLDHLESDRRPERRPSSHRRDQRLAHAADESRNPALGSKNCCESSTFPQPACRKYARRAKSMVNASARSPAFRSPARSATSTPRCSGKPASLATPRTLMAPAVFC